MPSSRIFCRSAGNGFLLAGSSLSFLFDIATIDTPTP
jgi:hypothetical protein